MISHALQFITSALPRGVYGGTNVRFLPTAVGGTLKADTDSPPGAIMDDATRSENADAPHPHSPSDDSAIDHSSAGDDSSATDSAEPEMYGWDTGERLIGDPELPHQVGARPIPGWEHQPDTRRRRVGADPRAEATGADYDMPAHPPGYQSEPATATSDIPAVETGPRRVPEFQAGELPSYNTKERPVVGADGSLPQFTDRDRYRSQPDQFPAVPDEEPPSHGWFRRRGGRS